MVSVFLVKRTNSFVKVKYQGHILQKNKRPLWGHLCFTNTSCLLRFLKIAFVLDVLMIIMPSSKVKIARIYY